MKAKTKIEAETLKSKESDAPESTTHESPPGKIPVFKCRYVVQVKARNEAEAMSMWKSKKAKLDKSWGVIDVQMEVLSV